MQAVYCLSTRVQTSVSALQASATVSGDFPRLRFFHVATLLLAMAAAPSALSLEDAPDLYALHEGAGDLSPAAVEARFAERLPTELRPRAPRLAKAVLRASRRHGLPAALLLAVIETESTFRPDARSHAGAVGLMQLRPSTAAEVARRYRIAYAGPQDLLDPAKNIELGAAYLAFLRERFREPRHFLAAYNLGPALFRAELRTHGAAGLNRVQGYVEKIHVRAQRLQAVAAI